MDERHLDGIILRKKQELMMVKPLLVVDTVGPDLREQLLEEVDKRQDLPLVSQVNNIVISADYDKLVSLYLQIDGKEDSFEGRLSKAYCLAKIGAFQAQLSEGAKRIITNSLEATFPENLEESDSGLNCIDVYLSLHPAKLPDNFSDLLNTFKARLGVKERIYLVKRISDLKYELNIDWLSDIRQTPEQIYDLRKTLVNGDVLLLEDGELDAGDLENLTAITAELGREVMLYYDKAINSFLYVAGGTEMVVTENKYGFVNQLLRDMGVDFHTHPAHSALIASEGDKDYWMKSSPDCRHFIGIHPRGAMDDKLKGLSFREFARNGEPVGDILNTEETANVLNITAKQVRE